MTIKEISRILRVMLTCNLALMAMIVALFETEVFMPGIIEKGSQTEFLILTLMEIITICTIPFALKMFKLGFVRRAIAADPASGLLRWGAIRICLICDPMVVNTLLYYITPLNVAFAYMAIIGLISLVFINPTVKRCEAESEMEENVNGKNALTDACDQSE